MSTIRVAFNERAVTLKAGKHHIHRGIYIMGKLREAGIPVDGALYPEGVRYGKLSLSTNEAQDVVFEWEGEIAPAPSYSTDDEI